MRYLSFLFAFLFLLPLSSCASTSSKNQFNAYLPRPFEEYFQEYYPLNKQETSIPNVWDVSDVDVSDVDKNRKLIAFTFDDAPSKTLEHILAVFASYNEQNPDCRATATIFYNGGRVEEEALPLLHTSLALGFELGNHTTSHFDLTTLDEEALKNEIAQTDQLLSKVDGKRLHLLRAPFGRINEKIKSILETPIIDWTIDTLDWTGASEEEIYRRIWEGRFSGGIVLMHDGYPHTVSALKRLLPDLKADGYQVVSVSAMAKMHNCPLKKGNLYIRARKQY